ncbi:MAG TPA: adenine deaminase, partial [Thermodesulfobacteriota bacterium]|nr:adenine deaminase [Thermodesulfobacteriota bacterium]
MTPKKLLKRIRAARGETPADLVLKGGSVIDVFSGKIIETGVAITDDTIVGLGSYSGKTTIDCQGQFICPGFIDGHLHIESTYLIPSNLAPVLLPMGTTTIISDPHEIANVQGLAGLDFMLQNSRGLPLEIYFMAPSCVPASPLETSGAHLSDRDLRSLLQNPRILGLGEMMNFPGVLEGDSEILKKVSAFSHRIKDGHAPLLTGKDLCAYIGSGIRSDHEATGLKEGAEKLFMGMFIMIREGTQARNLKALLPLVTPLTSRRCLLVSDDRHPLDLKEEGHLNSILKKAVRQGLDPVLAIQMVTLNPAEYFGLRHLGAVAPGYQADLVILKSLSSFEVQAVYKKGRLVARNGRFEGDPLPLSGTDPITAMHIKPYTARQFRIPAQGKWARVIQLVPGQILTRRLRHKMEEKDGYIFLNPKEDIVTLACVERHKRTGNIGLGLVKGFGLVRGALASSVAHDAHNILVAGGDPKDMYLAVRTVEAMNGGLVVVIENKVAAAVPLPIAGLMSDQPFET